MSFSLNPEQQFNDLKMQNIEMSRSMKQLLSEKKQDELINEALQNDLK